MEDQVAQAALAMISPTTDSVTRRQASQFLEEWTQTPESWEVYSKWLRSYRDSEGPVSPDQIAMQLLCCTMLQTKLRKELPRQQRSAWHPQIDTIRQELWEYLRKPSLDEALVLPCCICNVIIIVRGGMLQELLSHIGSTQELPPAVSLRLLACTPAEMAACQDLSDSGVAEQLMQFLEPVLDACRQGLADQATARLACQALLEWTMAARISLSQLNTPTCGGPHAILPSLVSLLSSGSCQDEQILVMAAKALTEAVMIVTDNCTPTREAAAAFMWKAIPQGFVVVPLRVATQEEWSDGCHALATLICTIVNEEIDDLIARPADASVQVLLDIQMHPQTKIALIPLDTWLTVQEIPMSERHEDWKRPLFQKVVSKLLSRMSYPPTFTDWRSEFEVDESDFREFRRLATDVLVGCYFMLRVELIQMLTHQIRSSTKWTDSEAALACLTTISRDVCARCRANGGAVVARDRGATCHELLQLLDQLVKLDSGQQNPLLLEAILNFCGSYSPAWNSMDCPPEIILQLLAYLQSTFRFTPIASAKAIRAVYVTCLSKSVPSLEDLSNGSDSSASKILPMVLESLRGTIKAVLATAEEEAMRTVAEGATRLVTKLKDPTIARQALVNDLLRPILQRGQTAIQALPEKPDQGLWLTAQAQEDIRVLETALSVLQVIVRFCDSPVLPVMGEWLIQEVGPFLENTQQRTASTAAQACILPKWVAVHQQLLRSTLSQQVVLIPIFTSTIPAVVQALEQTQEPSTLKYISFAVETFGGHSDEMSRSFQELLSHVTSVITGQSNLSEATELLQAYFECLQRYTLYCPVALCYNPQFMTIVTLAVESVGALQGAKESTRAALLFLSQLFGWNSLRLAPRAFEVLQEAWGRVLKDMLSHHGMALTQSCIVGLAGGPQMLWPAYSDCLFAIVQAVSANQANMRVHADPANSLTEATVQQWLYNSMSSVDPKSQLTPDTCNQVISILVHMARHGQKSRAKAKLLLSDFAKFTKGEVSHSELVSYTLA